MTPSEIAEQLHHGNVAQARACILGGGDVGLSIHHARVDSYRGAVLALDVVAAYALLVCDMAGGYPDYQEALRKVRMCLEGA